MDLEVFATILGLVLVCIALGLSYNHLSLIILDIFSLLIPCSLYLVISFLVQVNLPLPSEIWILAAISDYTGFSALFHFLLLHRPTSQLNARRTPFFIFLTILLVLTVFERQIEMNLQAAGFSVIPSLLNIIAASLFFGYIALEGIYYSTKILKHTQTPRKYHALLLSIGLVLTSVSFPLSFLLSKCFSPPFHNLLFIFLGTGALLIALALKADQTFPFLIPSQVLELGVFDKSGRELFLYRFQADIRPTEMKPGIIIGLQSLLSNLVSNSVSPLSSEIEEIKLRDRFILFDYSRDFEIFVIIILTTHPPLIKTMLREFLREFESKFKGFLEDLHQGPVPLDSEKFKEAITIINRLFAPAQR